MEKSFLEKRIEEKAQQRVDEDFRTLEKFFDDHPLASKLKILRIDTNTNMHILNPGCSYSLLYGKYAQQYTNLIEVKGNLFEQYKKEETDSLLNRLQQIEDFFNREP